MIGRLVGIAVLIFLMVLPVAAEAKDAPSDPWIVREFRHFRTYPRLDRGYRLYRKRNYHEAREMFAQVVEIDPDHIEARRMYIETCLKVEDLTCATEQALQLTAGPDFAQGYYYLARIFDIMGKPIDAMRYSRMALSAGGLDTDEGEYLLSVILKYDVPPAPPGTDSSQVEIRAEVDTLQSAYPYVDTSPKARHYLIIAYVKTIAEQGDQFEARKALVDAAAVDGITETMRLDYAETASSINECELSLELAQSVLTNKPDSQRAFMIAGYCQQRMGRPGLAQYYIAQARRLSAELSSEEQRQLARGLGFLHAELGDTPGAFREFALALDVEYDDSTALLAAFFAVDLEEYERAELLFDRIDTDALNEEELERYYVRRGVSAYNLGDFDRAQALYRRALETRVTPEAWVLLAEVRERTVDLDGAEDAFIAARDLAPEEVRYHSELAYFYLRNDLYPQAIDAFEAAIEVTPDDRALFVSLGYARLADDRFEESTEAFEEALAFEPDDPELWENLGYVQTRLGRDQDAANSFVMALELRYPAGVAKSKEDIEKQDVLKKGVRDLERRAYLLFANSIGTSRSSEPSNPLVRGLGYNGFGQIETGYRFDASELLSGGQLYAFGRLMWSNKDKSFEPDGDTLQSGWGIRYKPFIDYAVFASFERLLSHGSNSSDDWMLRLSGSHSEGLDFEPTKHQWQYQNLYSDVAFLTDSGVKIFTATYEYGRAFKQDWGFAASLTPYAGAGFSYNTNGSGQVSRTKMDIALGVSLFTWHLETDVKAHRLRNRLSIEARRKISGNFVDESTAGVKYELVF